jgi:NADH dehydrogenase (ubiquinone) Fe-S protein 1
MFFNLKFFFHLKVDTEALVAFKDLLNRFGCEQVYSEGDLPAGTGVDLRAGYLLNDRIVGVDNCDALLLVGTNPRYEVQFVIKILGKNEK